MTMEVLILNCGIAMKRVMDSFTLFFAAMKRLTFVSFFSTDSETEIVLLN